MWSLEYLASRVLPSKYTVYSDDFKCPTCSHQALYISLEGGDHLLYEKGKETRYIWDYDANSELIWFCCPQCLYYFAVCPQCTSIDEELWRSLSRQPNEPIPNIFLVSWGKRPYSFRPPGTKLHLCKFMGYEDDDKLRILHVPKEHPQFNKRLLNLNEISSIGHCPKKIKKYLQSGIPTEDVEIVEMGDTARDSDKINEYISQPCSYYMGDLDLHYMDASQFMPTGLDGGGYHHWKCM